MKRPIDESAVRKPLADKSNLLIIVPSNDKQENSDQTPATKKAVLHNLQNDARAQEETKPLKARAPLTSRTMPRCRAENGASNSSGGKINTVLPAKRQPQAEHSRTPYEIWKDEFQSYLKRHGFIGSLLVRGLKDSHVNHRSTADRSKLTREDLESLRYILITESRAEKLDFFRNKIIGEYNHPSRPAAGTTDDLVIVYDQHGTFGRHVYQVWKHWNRRVMFNVKLQSERLDWLVALTHTINDCDAWMYDNPEAADDDDDEDFPFMVRSLAATWRRLFDKERNENAILGWDQQYTRPGVLALLHQFKAKVEAYPSLGPFHALPTEQSNPSHQAGVDAQISTIA